MVSRKVSAPAAGSGSTNILDRGGGSNYRDQGGRLEGQHYIVASVKRLVITIKINQVTELGRTNYNSIIK